GGVGVQVAGQVVTLGLALARRAGLRPAQRALAAPCRLRLGGRFSWDRVLHDLSPFWRGSVSRAAAAVARLRRPAPVRGAGDVSRDAAAEDSGCIRVPSAREWRGGTAG